jgi:hypothetical protein
VTFTFTFLPLQRLNCWSGATTNVQATGLLLQCGEHNDVERCPKTLLL